MKWIVILLLIAGISGSGCGFLDSPKTKKKTKSSAKSSSRESSSKKTARVEDADTDSDGDDEDRDTSSKTAKTSTPTEEKGPSSLSRGQVRSKCESLFNTYRKRRVTRLNKFYKVLDTSTPAVEEVLAKENRDRDIFHNKIAEYEGRVESSPGKSDTIWQQDYIKRVAKFETAMSTQLEDFVKRRNKPAAKKVAKVKVSQKDLLYPKPVRKKTTRTTTRRKKTSSSCKTVSG